MKEKKNNKKILPLMQERFPSNQSLSQNIILSNKLKEKVVNTKSYKILKWRVWGISKI